MVARHRRGYRPARLPSPAAPTSAPRTAIVTRRTAALVVLALMLAAAWAVSCATGGPRAAPPARRPRRLPRPPAHPPVAAQRRPRPAAAVPDTRLVALGGGGPLMGGRTTRPGTGRPPARRHGIKRVRVTVPLTTSPSGGARLADPGRLVPAARQAGGGAPGLFFRSVAGMRSCPHEAEFRRNLRLFRERYPWVRWFSTWNEANFRAQPTSDPARTARFYRILREECSGGRCVVTLRLPARRARTVRPLAGVFKRGIGPGPPHMGPVVLRGREPPFHRP